MLDSHCTTPEPTAEPAAAASSYPHRVSELDKVWQDYLQQSHANHVAATRAMERVALATGTALGSEMWRNKVWDAECSPREVWGTLAEHIGAHAHRTLPPDGLSVTLDDAELQAMPEVSVLRCTPMTADVLEVLSQLSMRTIWDRYREAFDPQATRRRAHEQASRALRSRLWKHLPGRFRENAAPVRQRAGRFVLQVGYGRDLYASRFRISWESGERLVEEGRALGSICALEGEPEMGAALETGMAAAATQLREGYESRERVHVCAHMSIVMFKDKAEWHLTPALWTLLQAGVDWEEPNH